MAKTPTSVRSIRVTDDTWTWLTETADHIDSSPSRYISDLIDRDRGAPSSLYRLDISAEDMALIEAEMAKTGLGLTEQLEAIIHNAVHPVTIVAETTAPTPRKAAGFAPKPEPAKTLPAGMMTGRQLQEIQARKEYEPSAKQLENREAMKGLPVMGSIRPTYGSLAKKGKK